MSQALLVEQVIFDLWAGKQVSASDEYAQQIVRRLKSKGHVSGEDGHRALTSKGLEYILYGRDPNNIVDLLQDIEISQEERVFLANAMRTITDKPFAYEVIKRSRENLNRERYPSVDLGAYEDIEHGVLFGAKTHIMIDPLIGQRTIDGILQRLRNYGANVGDVYMEGDRTTNVKYRVGDAERELYLVGTEAMKVPEDIKRIMERGIFALMMKGWERFRRDVGDLKEALDHYSTFLIPGGLSLTRWPPETGLKKVGEGMVEYYTHLDRNQRLAPHGLYLK